jgi:endonuclease/exonuclease/phosphatase family metal-dependent hydrolase
MSFIRIMSFNIHHEEEESDAIENPSESWSNRAELNVQTIRRYDPSIIAFQEFSEEHWETYQNRFPEYEHCYRMDNGDWNGNAIFFKTDFFERIHEGFFWLTHTPDRPDADWGLPYALSVHWMILRLRTTGTPLLFMNTQYEDGADPEPYLMRAEGSKIHLQKVDEISKLSPGAPVIIAGDFNFHAWSEPYRFFLENGFVDTYRNAGLADTVDSSTFHGYKGKDYFSLDWGFTLAWRIDWILTRDGASRIKTVSCTIAQDANPPLYPSDHYPIVTELLIT